MPAQRRNLLAGVVCSILVVLVCWTPPVGAAADRLPERLTDAEFWALSQRLSEPDGYFRSDNLLSNELYFPEILDRLVARVDPGGVYLGVGPEQNFTYMAAVRPRIAFVTDVRRGNLHLQLLYKALFELSTDRADFVSRLFTKPRPPQLRSDSTLVDIMDAYWVTDTSAREVFEQNLAAVRDHLTKTRALPLSVGDIDGIADVYSAFYWFGPAITYASSSVPGSGRGAGMATYYQLMLSPDPRGQARSYLASEASFAFVKDLQTRNLIIPVVGDFGGAHALRTVGTWIRERGATVEVFYLSNVEQYLRQQGLQAMFCANVAAMPLTPRSTFIRSQSGGGGFRNILGDMQAETSPCGGAPAPASLTP